METSAYVFRDRQKEITDNLADSYDEQLALQNKLIKYGEIGAAAFGIAGLTIWLSKKININI